MESESSSYMELAKALLAFTDKNIWPIIILIIILLTRKSLARAVDRLIKLNFSFGGATGAVEAAHPTITSERPISLQVDTEEPAEQSGEKKSPDDEKSEYWLSKAFDAFDKKDVIAAKKSFDEEQREENDPKKRFENECLFLFLLFDNFNDLSALEKLESLNQNSKNDEQINTSTLWLSTIYRNLNDHKKTRKILETSIKMVNDDTIKTQIIIRLSTTINLLDGQDASIAMLEDRLQEVVSDTQKASIYEAIAEIFKENGKGTDQAIALEKAVEYSPGNKKLLFDAAYIQSNENLDIACIQNYLTLLSLEPGHPIALNNLGVSAGKHKIKGKQIELFNKSITNGSTLAMANLANIYIESGLYEEAAKILSQARNSENIHENIGTSFYTLKTQSSKDQEDWSALVKSSALLQRRIRAYGEAYFDNNFSVVNWAGDWSNSDKLKITLILESDTLSAEWDSLESAYATQSTFRYRLSGNVKNRSARLTLSKKQSPANPTSILGMANDYNFPCMAYISTDDKTLHIFSKNEKSITEFELFRL